MIGLIFLAIIVGYYLLAVAVTRFAFRGAARLGLSPLLQKLFGLGGFLLVVLPVFWDFVPTVVTWRSYCNQDAGLKVYKTVEQWKQENPGVAETLTYSDRISDLETFEGGDRYLLNQRFSWETRRKIPKAWGIHQSDETLIDRQTMQVIAHYRNYSTAVYGSMTGGAVRGLRDWKLWMARNTCEADEQRRPQYNAFGKLTTEFKQIGTKQ